MEKHTVKLYQRTQVKDAFGGSKEVLNYKDEITGYLVPATATLEETDNRAAIDYSMKFISDSRVSGLNLVVKFEDTYYEVATVKNLYHRGALMELKSNG